MTDYTEAPSSRSILFPADFFNRPLYRRLIRRWPKTTDWWLRIVLVAREALFKGQLLVGGEPLQLEDLQDLDQADPIPMEFISELASAGWIVGDGKTLTISKWSDWYRPPSRRREAEAQRSADRRAQGKRPQADRTPTVDRPQPTDADRTQPIRSDPIRSDPDPIQIRPEPASEPAAAVCEAGGAAPAPPPGAGAPRPRRPAPAVKGFGRVGDSAEATLERLREFNARNFEARPP